MAMKLHIVFQMVMNKTLNKNVEIHDRQSNRQATKPDLNRSCYFIERLFKVSSEHLYGTRIAKSQ